MNLTVLNEMQSFNQSIQALEPIQFIHVGKTGGRTVAHWLKDLNIPFKEHHIRKPKKMCNKNNPKKWLITVRDPVARVVSAFNWIHPKNNGTGSGWTNSAKEKEWLENYPFVNDFAEALADKNSTIQKQALWGFEEPVKHIGRGLEWYLKDDLDCILQQDYRLIHAESLEKDLKKVAKWLKVKKKKVSIPNVHGTYRMKNETHLSKQGRKGIKKSVKEEDKILKSLESNE